jgi:hypothetical protein
MSTPHPEPTDLDAGSCPKCGRTSYSLALFGWCPWCDTAHKPSAPRLTQTTIRDHPFYLEES